VVGTTRRIRLGDALIQKGVLTQSQLEIALEEQRQAHRPLGQILVQLGFVSQADIARRLCEELELPFVRAREVEPDAVLASGIDPDFARELGALPIRTENGRLLVAVTDPTNSSRLDALRARFRLDLELCVVTEADLELLIRRHLQEGRRAASSLLEDRGEEGGDLPVEQLVEAILKDAARRGATDVHLQPEEAVLRVRLRLDGVLRQVDVLPAAAAAPLISRIKILAGLDISERRRPQDGRIRFPVDGREIDLRVSVMPVSHGEAAVLRLLDRAAGNTPLTDLGLSSARERLLRSIADRPHGLFLVTGPTGSGKTTTLYSLLAQVDCIQRCVATVEDPVEYRLPFVRQTQVDPGVEFSFGEGLRSLLRQDPDVILLGEIRDQETAQIAVRAAMTGHLVLSTLHTNSAAGALPRLLDMGIEPLLLGDVLAGVLAQRLVRRVCDGCSQPAELSESEAEWLAKHDPASLGLDPTQVLPGPQRGAGCKECDGTGYSGRTVISELLEPTPALFERLRSGGAAFDDVIDVEPMSRDGLRKVHEGITTLEEVRRVCGGELSDG
jgi:MSHA biogenesis protein MshE